MESGSTKAVNNEFVQTTVAHCKNFWVDDGEFYKLGLFAINIKVSILIPSLSTPTSIISDEISQLD